MGSSLERAAVPVVLDGQVADCQSVEGWNLRRLSLVPLCTRLFEDLE